MECLTRSMHAFIRNSTRSGAIRLLLVALTTRNFAKVWNALQTDAPRFGAAIGAATALFHIIVCLLKRLEKNLDKKSYRKLSSRMKAFIAAMVSVIPMYIGLQEKEKNLMKLFFFPLAFRCLSNKTIEIGLVPRPNHGDILAYGIFAYLIGFGTLMEWNSCNPAIKRNIQREIVRMQPCE